MALEAQNNPFTSVLMVEAADVEALPDADPSAGSQRLAVGTDHLLYLVNSSGTKTLVGSGTTVATDTLWDAAGDLVQGSGANTGAKLSAGTSGQVLTAHGAAAALTWETPTSSGGAMEMDYAQVTSDTNCTATTEATANTIVTGASVAYDGSTSVLIEFSAYAASPGGTNGIIFTLYDGSSSIGYMGQLKHDSNTIAPVRVSRRLTPSAGSHTYSVRVWNVAAQTSTVYAGVAGISAAYPAFLRITRADIGSGGTMATDALWDAAGDLAVGTGANTGAKLSIGASGTLLQSNGTTATWVAPGAYTGYTPALSASPTPPTLGSGSSAVGRWYQLGKHVVAYGAIAFGTSGTNAGSGTYTISLPATMRTPVTFDGNFMGTGYIFDSSASALRAVIFKYSSTTVSDMLLIDGSTSITHASPWAWAASDVLIFHFDYEAA